jgi:hypothetical protein
MSTGRVIAAAVDSRERTDAPADCCKFGGNSDK